MATYTRLSFTNEEEKQLIAFIEKHPSMWDPQNADYNNVRMRSQHWQNISQQLDKSDVDCRRKWRFIRDYYLNKRKRLREGGKNYESKYANLDFLKQVAGRRLRAKRESNAEPALEDDVKIEAISESEEQSLVTDNNMDENVLTTVTTSNNSTPTIIDEHATEIPPDEAQMEEHLEDISDSDLDFSDVNENEMSLEVTTPNVEMQCEPVQNSSPLEELTEEVIEATPARQPITTGEAIAMPIVEISSPTPPSPPPPPTVSTMTEPKTCSTVTVEAMSTQNIVTQDRVIDLFFESMAATVKTFPPALVAKAKMGVFHVINELEMQLHQLDN